MSEFGITMAVSRWTFKECDTHVSQKSCWIKPIKWLSKLPFCVPYASDHSSHRSVGMTSEDETSLNMTRSAFLCVCRWQHHKHSLFRVLQHQNGTVESVWPPAVVLLPVTTCRHTGLKPLRILISCAFICKVKLWFPVATSHLCFFFFFLNHRFSYSICPYSQTCILGTAGHLKVHMVIWWSACPWRLCLQPFLWIMCPNPCHPPATLAVPLETSMSM